MKFNIIHVFVDKWIMAFSIKENFMSSISMERPSTDIETVHGIRCVNAILLLVSHKSMAVFFQPAPNRTAYVEVSKNTCLSHWSN